MSLFVVKPIAFSYLGWGHRTVHCKMYFGTKTSGLVSGLNSEGGLNFEWSL